MRKPTVTGVAESDHAAPASAPVSGLVESGPTTRAAGAGDHPEGQEPGAYRRTISPTGRDRTRPHIGMSVKVLATYRGTAGIAGPASDDHDPEIRDCDRPACEGGSHAAGR